MMVVSFKLVHVMRIIDYFHATFSVLYELLFGHASPFLFNVYSYVYFTDIK